jgi:hypothetical protein
MSENNFSRLRSLVDAIPDGDRDKEDLLALFATLDSANQQILHLEEDKFELLRQEDSIRKESADKIKKAKESRAAVKRLTEERRQLSGALEFSRYILKEAHTKIESQKISIGWLCRRIRGSKSWDILTSHEKQEVKNIQKQMWKEIKE